MVKKAASMRERSSASTRAMLPKEQARHGGDADYRERAQRKSLDQRDQADEHPQVQHSRNPQGAGDSEALGHAE